MKNKHVVLSVVIALVLSACTQQWAFTVIPSFDEEFQVNEKLLESYSELKVEVDTNCEGMLLEIVLYQNGIEVIQSIEVTGKDGEIVPISKEDLIEGVCVGTNGELAWDEALIYPETIAVDEYDLVLEAGRIQDVTATTAYALGLEMEGLYGSSMVSETYEHVALLFLDGFSYKTYQQAVSEDLIPNITKDSSAVYQAITVYPPRTTTSSAAVLTGLTPNDNGVNKTGIRKTEAYTIFDAAADQGLTSTAIEGESLSFNLRNTTTVLSGDRDNNGGTDDNTFANAMEVLEEGIPDLVWIHFHGIDDLGHSYGPVTDEVLDKVVEVDGYVGQIQDILPENTLIIIFADHGMHFEKEEDDFGNHGNLIIEDMVIPIIIKTK